MTSHTPFDWVMLGVTFGTVVLGLVIGYQAYRGFRRNDSRPMQFLSMGLILLTAIAYSMAFLGTLGLRLGYIPLAYQRPLTLVVRVIQFTGVAFITYSLYKRP